MLAFGITAKVDQEAIGKIFSTILPSSSQKELDAVGLNVSEIIASNATFMIVLGVIAVVIAIFGFVGACCMIRWMLVVVSVTFNVSVANTKINVIILIHVIILISVITQCYVSIILPSFDVLSIYVSLQHVEEPVSTVLW